MYITPQSQLATLNRLECTDRQVELELPDVYQIFYEKQFSNSFIC